MCARFDGEAAASNQPARWVWATLALTAMGAALRFAALGEKTLWLDETFSLWMARHELPALLKWIVAIDHHPPLYYLLLHFWVGAFGDTPAALRSLSAVTSTLAIPFFALATRKLAGRWIAFVATLLLVLSPFHIRYAQETRMYGVLTLAVALIFFALAHLLTAKEELRRMRWWAWALLVVAEAAAMLTHNTATVLVPVALNVAVGGLWLAKRREEAVGEAGILAQPHFHQQWLLSQIATLALWSPWASAFVRQAQVVESSFWIEPPNLWTVWLALGSLTFAYLPEWLPLRDYLQWLALILVLWGAWWWRRDWGLTWLLMALWLVPPLIELLAGLRRPIFYDRTLIWTTLPYFVLLARGIVLPPFARSTLPRAWRMGWSLFVAVLMCALCVLGVRNYYMHFEKEDWDQVAALVAQEAQPQELILFHASWAQIPFDYYYPADAPPLVQRGVPADLFAAGALEPPMTTADVPRVQALIQGHKRVWLVYSHWWYTDTEGLLVDVLEEQLKLVEAREWPGIQVLRYEVVP